MQSSVVKFSSVKAVFDLRIDSEFWHPEFIKNSGLVKSDVQVHYVLDTDSILNIKSSPIDTDFDYLEIAKISLSSGDYETSRVMAGAEPDRAHHILQKRDVAVSTVRPNRNAVAFIEEDGIVGSSGLAVLRAKNIDSAYLFAFCKTDYFIKCLMRVNKASMYPAVSHSDVLDVPIPRFAKLEKRVGKLVDAALETRRFSREVYKQAESLLLGELGLADWRPEHRLTFVKSYADVVKFGDLACFVKKRSWANATQERLQGNNTDRNQRA